MIHPGFWGWWQQHHRSHGCCGQEAHASGSCCGPKAPEDDEHSNASSGCEDGAAFGVRRPLRFLAHKLELEDEQVNKLAAILDALKTERAQADVDQRRRVSALADAFEAAAFDREGAETAGQEAVQTAQRLKVAVTTALAQIHSLLNESQRKKFAYYLRTGTLTI
jgi:Spy/CpxP family protein refolding chaperone